MTDEPKLTEDEHHARAMLMGMRYHHGNGAPFYYEPDKEDAPLVSTMIDANTLKPIFEDEEEVSSAAQRIVDKAKGHRDRWWK